MINEFCNRAMGHWPQVFLKHRCKGLFGIWMIRRIFKTALRPQTLIGIQREAYSSILINNSDFHWNPKFRGVLQYENPTAAPTAGCCCLFLTRLLVFSLSAPGERFQIDLAQRSPFSSGTAQTYWTCHLALQVCSLALGMVLNCSLLLCLHPYGLRLVGASVWMPASFPTRNKSPTATLYVWRMLFQSLLSHEWNRRYDFLNTMARRWRERTREVHSTFWRLHPASDWTAGRRRSVVLDKPSLKRPGLHFWS